MAGGFHVPLQALRFAVLLSEPAHHHPYQPALAFISRPWVAIRREEQLTPFRVVRNGLGGGGELNPEDTELREATGKREKTGGKVGGQEDQRMGGKG